MSWTVACFCGTVFHAPPDRCPTCGTPLPDVSHSQPIEAGAPSIEVALEHVARVTSAYVGGQGPRPAKRGSLTSS